jgi:hypothetical protein
MLTRMFAAALLIVTAVPVFASDASYDKREAPAASQKESAPRAVQGPSACSCQHS